MFYDLDDDLWHLPEDNPAREHYTPENLATLEENCITYLLEQALKYNEGSPCNRSHGVAV